MKVRIGLLAAIATLVVVPPATAALRHELDAGLETGRSSSGAPAATAGVARCGKLIWSGAAGVLDLQSGRPATPNARIAIASTTKPFTAALVFDLIERRKLHLGTRLSRFYPSLPAASKITIRMLLGHTSGLSEYFDDPQISQTIATSPGHHWTRREVLRGITRTLFEPGTQYSYSNSGYLVLGGVIEKLKHHGIERDLRTRIAKPLHLRRTTFTYRPSRSYLFAHPYVFENGSFRDAFAPGVGVPSDYWGPVWADGGLASTAPDVARFGDGLFRGKLLRRRTLRTLTRRNRFGHSLGIDRQPYAGRTWLGHNGRYGGYESELWYDRARGLTIAVTTNRSFSSLLTWKALVDAYDRARPGARRCRR